MFFASDGDEPPHTHVKREDMQVKYWITPQVILSKNEGFAPHELTRIQRLVVEHRQTLLERWNDYFNA